MKKYLLLFLVVLLFSSNTFGALEDAKYPVFESEFLEESKFDVDGSLTIRDVNDGKFHYNDGVQAVYRIRVDQPQEICFTAGLEDSIHGEIINCNPEFPQPLCLSSTNGTIYGYCDIQPKFIDHEGHYFFWIHAEDGINQTYYLETIDVIHSRFSDIMWVTLSLSVFFVILGLITKQGVSFVPALISFLVFSIDAAFITYDYMFGVLGIGFIGIIFLLLIYVIIKLINESLQ